VMTAGASSKSSHRHVWTAPSRQEHFWYFGK
jgi:hypothetical protein